MDIQLINICEDDDINHAFIRSLDKSKPLKVVINSHGGSFQASSELKTLLSGFKHITVEVSDLMCGTYLRVLTYAGKIVASEKARFYWMGASMICYGNAAELKQQADKIREVELELIKEFQEAFGISLDDIKDKWLSVSEMKALGVPIEIVDVNHP
ncbi:ATP-dependent Clp protease proteolytic subunit [Vibrio furnissii]|uniref:ATP-dependent Clp protease proteolytic subunit n=1 Tax=Vibrio furnissii TaxID=29494 RepID=UPI001EEC7ABE|nr:ATP-dependent Clp protease proteolytic subunit [Vibrio furnissii]